MAAQPTETDVLIAGSGSAGLCAALWLTRLGIPHLILERRDGPLQRGQADGVQCRTVEIFESFGLSEELLREAYHVLEVAFWSVPEAEVEGEGKMGGSEKELRGGIVRTHFAADAEPGLSHLPHVILNQARINGLMSGEIERSGGKPLCVEYDTEVKNVRIDEQEFEADKGADGQPLLGRYPVCVTAVKDGVEREYRAKYVLGCDGAHSAIRKSLSIPMLGDSSDKVWGVMDIYPRTTFPDIRKKAVIHSRAGSAVLIPREGDSLVRFYLEQPAGTAAGDVTLARLTERLQLILAPYAMDIAETEWWSAYSIGQRLAERFEVAHRVFLTGDACHTHSPKAGQGMNVSLQDGYNLGWKLGAVLSGRAAPALLETYVSERQETARQLIEFDRDFTRLFSSKYRRENGISAEYFAEQFVKAGRYTAGLGTRYGSSLITAPPERTAPKGLVVGMRFPGAQAVRFSDAKAMPLIRALPSDGRWRIVVFGGDIKNTATKSRLQVVDTFISKVQLQYSNIQALLVLRSKRTDVSAEEIPEVFWPAEKRGIRTLHNIYFDDESYNSGHGYAYESFGVDPLVGALVVVRPDQYMAWVSTLEPQEGLLEFFRAFMCSDNTSR